MPTEGEPANDSGPRPVEIGDGYRQELRAFTLWHRESRRTDPRWEKLGSNDLINDRQDLVCVERPRAATARR
jgi:hypothetical protein